MSVDDVNKFLPSEDNREHNVLRFTTNIKRLAEGCMSERDAYVTFIQYVIFMEKRINLCGSRELLVGC